MENETKHCPYCDEEIQPNARKCKHCGEWLTEEDRLADYQQVEEESSGYIIGAIVGGVISMVLCAFLWVLVVEWTNYEHGFYALVVGAIVGFAVRWTGRGETAWFGIIAAVCAVVACFWGETASERVEIDFISLAFYTVAAIEAYSVARNQSDDDDDDD